MNELHLKYKSEYGLSPFSEYESELMQNQLHSCILEDFSKRTILDMINDDEIFWSVKMDNIKDNLSNDNDLKIYSINYVKWLENELNNKL